MHYVIGDVHGCYSELVELLNKIENKDSDAEYIFVGDWFDRGSEVYDTLLWMSENITPNGKYQSVRGNHDHEALEWFDKEYLPWQKITKDFETPYLSDTYYDFKECVIE